MDELAIALTCPRPKTVHHLAPLEALFLYSNDQSENPENVADHFKMSSQKSFESLPSHKSLPALTVIKTPEFYRTGSPKTGSFMLLFNLQL